MNVAKRAALRLVMKRYTKAKTVSKQAAVQAFVDEGMFTQSGKLTPEYGGDTQSKKGRAPKK